MNKKGLKIIQISGFRGIFLLCFVLFGLFCGFVVFPVWMTMQVWNYIVVDFLHLPEINAIQGSLMWSIICLLAYMSFKNSFAIRVHSDESIKNDIELKSIVQEYEQEKEEVHK